MLKNFIFVEDKSLFLKELEAGNVSDNAIVFIEDTKEIWNHGVYFGANVNSEDLQEIWNVIGVNDFNDDFNNDFAIK